MPVAVMLDWHLSESWHTYTVPVPGSAPTTAAAHAASAPSTNRDGRSAAVGGGRSATARAFQTVGRFRRTSDSLCPNPSSFLFGLCGERRSHNGCRTEAAKGSHWDCRMRLWCLCPWRWLCCCRCPSQHCRSCRS
jgi:hypothetical protein